MEYSFFQEYWWFLISVLGAALVFLLFVQGGQSMFIQKMPESQRESLVEAVEHRWELTFTTLVVFGGAFFASFPLFYSTSFGGASWIWILILLGFVVQAVSYRYRKAEGNLIGRRAYDIFLFLNGITAPLLLGGAVSTFFFGSDVTVSKAMMAENGGAVSQWGPWHGLEVLADWRVLLFGIMVLFLARVLANLWYINQIDEEHTKAWNRRQLLVNAGVFVVAFLASVAVILTVPGYETVGAHEFKLVKYKYFHNLPCRNCRRALCDDQKHPRSGFQERIHVRRCRYGPGCDGPLLDSRLFRHSLLSIEHRCGFIPDHLQFILIGVYPEGDEHSQSLPSCSHRLHLLGLVQVHDEAIIGFCTNQS